MNKHKEGMLELEAFYLKCYTLEHTKRYSMVPVLKEESVASHSYFVALGALLLHQYYDFNLEKAISMALVHDLAEIEISDVNHLVKKKYPELKTAIKDVEREISNDFSKDVQDLLISYEGSSSEAMVVHYADAMQCLQYASSEISMGNNENMSRVKINSQDRMKVLIEEMEHFRRGN
tara:strand:+ start:384 stop:914 length:531 start_codon:yes stop_codon:yes gene_type:complete